MSKKRVVILATSEKDKLTVVEEKMTQEEGIFLIIRIAKGISKLNGFTFNEVLENIKIQGEK